MNDDQDQLADVDLASRRVFLTKTAAAAAGAAVLGAVGPALPAAAHPARRAGSATVNLRFSYWMAGIELAAFKRVLPRFEQLNPGIKITLVDVGPASNNWGQQKVETMIAGNNAPDVMQLNTGQFEAFAAKGALLPLDSYFKRDHINPSALYVPGTLPGISYGGKIYGTPRFLSTHCVIYNKDKFKQAGVPFPKSGWTWNDFRSAALKLTNAGKHQWGFGMTNNVWNWIAFVGGNGGQVISADRKHCLLNDPKVIEALQFFFDLQSKDKVVPPPGSVPPGQSFAGDQFIAGTVAMCMVGPWERPTLAAAKLKFQWDAVTTPVSPHTHRTATAVYTDQFSVSSATAHPNEAWQFAKWLGSEDYHRRWLDAFGPSSIDAVRSVVALPKFANYDGHSIQPFLQELKVGSPPPINFPVGEQVQNIWDQEFQLVQLGEETAATAVQKITPKIDATLQGPGA